MKTIFHYTVVPKANVEAPKKRKSRTPNRLRAHEAMTEGEAALPDSHFLNHYPKDPRCAACNEALGAEDPAMDIGLR